MKYITFALALLGVVGSIKLDQVPTVPMNTFAQINYEDIGGPVYDVACAIEASKDKSVDREQLTRILTQYYDGRGYKDRLTKEQIKNEVEWFFDKFDAHGDKNGRITREELQKLLSKKSKWSGLHGFYAGNNI